MSVESHARLTAKGAARREAILRAAESLILEEGYASFSARGVAARAGVALSHVQYYFATPSDMIGELLRGYVGQYANASIGAFRKTKGASEDRLAQTLTSLFASDGVREKCALFMIEVASLGVRESSVREALKAYYAAYLEAVRALIAELEPALSASERNKRAPQILALIEGTYLVSGPLPARDRQALAPRNVAQAIMRLLAI